jgi:hypothetical protein
MRIKIEPKEFFMYSVFLAFCKEQPDPEDDAIKAYLDEHELIPKIQGTDQIDGEAFEVLYFGGCYLGNHLQIIEDMQRQAVEHDLLRAEIENVLQGATAPGMHRVAEKTPEPELQALIATLTQAFHQDASFEADEQGYLKVSLDPTVIQQRFLELVANRGQSSRAPKG